MQRLLEKLRHNLSRSGLMEGHEPWIELNVGQDGHPRVAMRNSIVWLTPIEKSMMLELSKLKDLPPGTQLVFSAMEHDVDPTSLDDTPKRRIAVSVSPPASNMVDRAIGIIDMVVKKHRDRLSSTGGGVSKSPQGGILTL
jgi:hypothetical protein